MKQFGHPLPLEEESTPIALDVSFHLWNNVSHKVMLLIAAIIGSLKCSFIAPLLKMCLIHQYSNQYSLSRENLRLRTSPSMQRLKYSVLIALPAIPLCKGGVTSICVRTESYSEWINEFWMLDCLSVQSSSDGWRKLSACCSERTGNWILSCYIATPSSDRCSADMYTILSFRLWGRGVMLPP